MATRMGMSMPAPMMPASPLPRRAGPVAPAAPRTAGAAPRTAAPASPGRGVLPGATPPPAAPVLPAAPTGAPLPQLPGRGPAGLNMQGMMGPPGAKAAAGRTGSQFGAGFPPLPGAGMAGAGGMQGGLPPVNVGAMSSTQNTATGRSQMGSGVPLSVQPAAQAAMAASQEEPEGAPAAAEDDYWSQAQAEYEGIMADDEKSWQDQQGVLQGEMAGFQREADSINARMGGSIAGGYAGLAGAALGEGMRAYNNAAQDYANRRRATQLAWLDKKVDQGQRQEEHGWAMNDGMSQATLDQLLFEESGLVPGANTSEATSGGFSVGGSNYTGNMSEDAAGQTVDPASEARVDYYTSAVNDMPDGPAKDQAEYLLSLYAQYGDPEYIYQIQELADGGFETYNDAQDRKHKKMAKKFASGGIS